MNLAISLLFLVVGALCAMFPQWFYKKVTPEQQAKDRKVIRTTGAIMVVLGLLLLVVKTLQ